MTVDERFDRIEKVIEGLTLEMRQGFTELRTSNQELRTNVQELRTNVQELRGGQQELRTSVQDLRDSHQELRKDVSQIREYVLDFRREVINRFDVMNTHMRVLASTADSYESRMSAINRAAMEQGATSTELAREQWRQKDATFELAERLTRLEAEVNRLKNPAA
jgi:methyl-accepting chemotaxis protein